MRNAVTVARFLGRQDITASTTSAVTAAGISSGVNLIRVVNLSGALAYVRQGASDITVSASNGFPIAAGAGHYFAVAPGEYVAGILASGTGSIAVCEMGA